MGTESDRDLLSASHALWRDGSIHHPHFAAFRPIEDTPLEGAPETPILRENRPYQADYLLTRHGLAPEESVHAPRVLACGSTAE